MSNTEPISVPTITGFNEGSRVHYYIMKRVIDVVVSFLAIAVLAPLALVIAVAIRLETPGPVIFSQLRLRGRRTGSRTSGTWSVEPFRIYKFRTMEADADPSLHRRYMTAYLTGDQNHLAVLRPGRKDGDSYRPSADPRVTRVGAVLRKLSLDELPQLWNVLRGDMSLVGPRPPVPYEVELYEERHLPRLASPGGITGWAQVRGRCAIGFEEMVRLDVDYIERQSIWFDLKVLALTFPVVISRKGAD